MVPHVEGLPRSPPSPARSLAPQDVISGGHMVLGRGLPERLLLVDSAPSSEGGLVVLQVQIAAVEVTCVGELSPVANGDGTATPSSDKALSFQAPYGAVHMHSGKAHGVGKLLLRHWQFVVRGFAQPGHFQP